MPLKSPLKCLWHDCSNYVKHPCSVKPRTYSHLYHNQAQIEDCIDIRQGKNDNTIAIKSSTADNGRSHSFNTYPKIRNSDYVTGLYWMIEQNAISFNTMQGLRQQDDYMFRRASTVCVHAPSSSCSSCVLLCR